MLTRAPLWQSPGAPSRPMETPQPYELQPEQELRIEVDHSASIELTLLKGNAECYGAELAPMHKYAIAAGSKLAVFTYRGCVLEVSGKPKVAYIGRDTPMIISMNVHEKLEARRVKAQADGVAGPRVLVCGPTDSGKSTLCRVLVNYAVRAGHRPMFVDLDVGQGQITVPGALAASPVTRPIGMEDAYPISMPLCFYYGHDNLGVNTKHFTTLVQRMAAVLDEQCEMDPEARTSGQIINSCGWVDGEGYNLLVDAIKAFRVDVVVVLSDERLSAMLTNDVGGDHIKIVRLQKSGGVVTRDKGYRRKCRMGRVREYFYGMKSQFSPDLRTIPFSEVRIFQVGTGNQADQSALPFGARSELDPLALTEVTPSLALMHSILVVTYAESPENIMASNAAGFVHVQEVDVQNEQLTILAPCPGQLPGKFLLAGTVKWLESND